MEFMFVPLVKVGDVALFDNSCIMWAVDVDFEFVFVFFSEVPDMVEGPFVLFGCWGKFLGFFCSARWDKVVEPDEVGVVLVGQFADVVEVLVVYGCYGACESVENFAFGEFLDGCKGFFVAAFASESVVDFFRSVDADAGPDLVFDEVVVDGAVDEDAVGEEADVETFVLGVVDDFEDVGSGEGFPAFYAEPSYAEFCHFVYKVEGFLGGEFAGRFSACSVDVAVFASGVAGSCGAPRSHE